MIPTILPATEVRNNFAHVLSELKKQGLPCLVTQNGRAVAAMLSIDQYEALMDALEDYVDANDPEFHRDIALAEEELKNGQYRTL